jgi:hypothetical protein
VAQLAGRKVALPGWQEEYELMWIIRVALKRPCTFAVAALLLLLVTPFVLMRTPTDTGNCRIKPQAVNDLLSTINYHLSTSICMKTLKK